MNDEQLTKGTRGGTCGPTHTRNFSRACDGEISRNAADLRSV